MRRECRESFTRPRGLAIQAYTKARCLTNVPWCMPGSLTSGFLWSRWRGERSRHSRCSFNTQFCVSGQRPMAQYDRWRVRWPPLQGLPLRCHIFKSSHCTSGVSNIRIFSLRLPDLKIGFRDMVEYYASLHITTRVVLHSWFGTGVVN